MPEQTIVLHTMANGVTLIIEPMAAVQSAAVTLQLPAGVSHEAAGKNGTSALLGEMMLRGAGDLDSRGLSTALDNLGVHHSLSPGWFHLTLSAATVATRLPEALVLLTDIVRKPRLDADQFANCRIGREQILRSIEDEPKQKLMIELKRRCYAPPYNRPVEGSLKDLEGISLDDLSQHYQRCCVPQGAVIGIAGRVDPEQLIEQCEKLFGDWEGELPPPITELEPRDKSGHLDHESTQTHIGIAYPTVPVRHPDYYRAWAAVSILSGGMSSRLFTKVREERGLCYAIGASLNSLRDRARVLCYAGTTNERAQETLDVTLQELANYGDDVTESELSRCKARAKSSLIMQGESAMSRSGSLVRDWFHLGRITTLDEIRDRVDNLTVEEVREFAVNNTAQQFQVLTIGPEPLSCQGQVDLGALE